MDTAVTITEEDVEEKTEFSFAELDDRAKQRAIDWYAEGQGNDWEPEFDDIVTCFRYLGIEFGQQDYRTCGGQTRYRPAIHYAISYSQGDGANFEGEWAAERMDLAGLHGYAPQDDTLHRLGAKLLVVMLCHPRAECRIRLTHYGLGLGSLSVEGAVTGEPDASEDNENLDDALGELLVDVMEALAGWIYDRLRDDLEYQTSEEFCIEGIEANDYTFDEEGRCV